MSKKTSKPDRPQAPLFPRITFKADDVVLSNSVKLDPMLKGVDLVALKPVTQNIELMQERLLLPPEYSVHDAFQLLPKRASDTTDRSTVTWAQNDHFDTLGFQEGRPLAKDIYYTDPYVVCHWCNAINFVDVIAVRRMMVLPEVLQSQIDNEPIPVCQCCKKTNFFEIGPKIFPNVVKEREVVIEEVIATEEAAAVVLKRAYRLYLRRMYGRAFRATLRAHNLLRYRAATCITKNARVRLARRQLKTERFLLVIKDANDLLLSMALLPTSKSSKKLFWYSSKEHERMLYADYISFMDRTGFEPPRCVVEDNIAEIATRIRLRQNMLCTRVQKRWRGLLHRRMIVLYKSECLWLRQWREGRILMIQRMFRAHNSRLKLIKLVCDSVAEAKKIKYREWRHEKKLTADRQLAKELTRSAYMKERAVEKTARFSGRVEYSQTKMKDFMESIYGDDRMLLASIQVAKDEHVLQRKKEKEKHDRHERREFLMGRIAEHGPKGYGKRGFAPELKSLYSAAAFKSLDAISSGELTGDIDISEEENGGLLYIRESSRSHGMRSLFDAELGSLTEKVIQDAALENISSPSQLHQQFKTHNARTDLTKFKNYRYPSEINIDKMAVLFEEIPRSKGK